MEIGILIDTTAQNVVAQGTGLVSSNSISVTGTGIGKSGVMVIGSNTYFGNITLNNLTPVALTGAGSTLTLSGDSSVGFNASSGTHIDGDVTFGGSITVLRSATPAAGTAAPIMAQFAGTVYGNVVFDNTVAGSIVGNGSQGVVVLGATNKNTEVVFGKSRITLAEAIGNGGGLADKQADPYGVYVLRNEMTATAQRLRAEPIPDYMAVGDTVPVIYHVNMKSVDGMLLAQNFTMQDRDVVYVANSPSVQVGKLANLFNSISGIFKSNTLNQYTY